MQMSKKLNITLVRHGSAASNVARRYLGRSDEPLCAVGVEQARARLVAGVPTVEKVFSSPLCRCIETAEIIFPSHVPVIIDDFIELDFGRFEGHTHDDLIASDPAYKVWLDSGGISDIPGGESRAELIERTKRGFFKMLSLCTGLKSVAAVVHSGTIMALLSSFSNPPRKFYECYIGNCETAAFDFEMPRM